MRLLSFLGVLFLLALPVKAQENEIRGVISSQIESFLKDDFATAFTFAAPNIKQIFRTPERFGKMVATGYPMVHRPSDVTFQDLEQIGQGWTQDVLIRDQGGRYYVARYTMVKVDGHWQISGVTIEQSPGVGA